MNKNFKVGLLFTLLTLVLAHHEGEADHLIDYLLKNHNVKDEKSNTNVGEILNNYIDNILYKVVDKVKTKLAAKEPYPLPDSEMTEIKDNNMQINITLSNLKENKISELKVNKLNNNFFLLTEQFELTFPEVQLNGNHKTDGKISGKSAHGSGSFDMWLKNIHSWGKAYVAIVHGEVQLKNLIIDYTIEDIKVSTTGLTVKGLTQEQVNNLLSASILKYYKDNERSKSDEISQKIMNRVNNLFHGMSVSDVINWLIHFIIH